MRSVPCSWGIIFFPTLNFLLMISSPTPTSFFQVPASKVPDPIEKFAGMIVSGRHTLGLREAWVCAVLQEERGMEQ